MTNYKKYFPVFESNNNLHYLDSGATTLKPLVVIEKIGEYYRDYSANIHRGLYPMSLRASDEYDSVRNKVANFIGAESDEIVFTSGTTMGLNMVALGWGENNLNKGDEIVVTMTEHHSNFVPWQELAKRKDLKFSVGGEITKNTKLLAINHVSNVLGSINNIKEIIKNARSINPSICVVVDGAQAVAHLPVNVIDLDADFYAFSGHKMYGPTGVGVLWAKKQRWQEMRSVFFGGGMISTVTTEESTWASGPERFEAGTPPIAEVIGLGAAIDFINKIGFSEIVVHEKKLTNYLLQAINKISWIEVAGLRQADGRLGVVSIFPTDKRMGTSHEIGDILARDGVCVRAGHHCTMPLHTSLGMETGTIRASIGIYNDESDIEALVSGLNKAWTIFIEK